MGSLEVLRPPERAWRPAPTVGGTGRRTLWWPALLAGGWLTHFVVRLLFLPFHRMPVLVPDETGYLLAARLLSGGDRGDLSGRTLYEGGYPLLISPAFHASDDPATVYRIVLVINALIGAFLFVLAYAALRRLGLSRVPAYAVAMTTGLLPSALYYGQFALTDAVLPVVVLGWMLCIHSWMSRGGMGHGAAAAALAAYTASVHVRGDVIVVVHAALLMAVFVRRWAPRRDVAAATGVLALGVAAGALLNRMLQSQIYPGGPMDLDGFLVQRLTSLDGWGWTLGLTAGKLWYLVVSTWGVAGAGLAAAGFVAVRRGAGRALRVSALAVLAAMAGIALASSAAVPDEGTVANFAYGRYLACFAPVLFLAGAALALRRPRREVQRAAVATVMVTLLCAVMVMQHAGQRLYTDFFGVFDFPEMSVVTWSWDALKPGWATLAVLPGLALLVLLKNRRMAAAALVLVVVLNIAVVTAVSVRETRYWGRRLDSATSLAVAGLTARDVVALDYGGVPWRVWVSQAFQVRTHLRPLDRFDPSTLAPDATLAVVPWDPGTPPAKSWPGAPANFTFVAARWTYTGAWAVWRRTS
ncbi:hypothetical protein [Actinomadura sp. K4S16]|uniref:hypothetical protein n=1 Tax=Actinomadura sp. K4S16 TaxID=1316147 RepID=UPI0011EF0540|nr:hypothetical protein [Actinomadura sp. K4S16]